MSEFNVDDILAEFRDGKRKKTEQSDPAPAPKSTPKSVGATDVLKSIEKKQSSPVSKTAAESSPQVTPSAPKPVAEKAVKEKPTSTEEDYDEYKPTEPLFSLEQLRKIEAQRKENIRSSKVQTEDKPKKVEEKSVELHEPLSRPALKKQATAEKPAPVTEKKAENVTESKAENKKTAISKAEPIKKKTTLGNDKPATKKPATIFGDIEQVEKKPKKEKVNVRINTNPFTSITDKVSQYRFLFEQLVKRDFKKKYKRTVLGMLWSVLSPFLTFLIQLFVFGSLFKRGDSNFIIYLLTGNLMFHFFSDTTNTGMFSMYSNAAVLSKINAPKTVFLLASNVAGVFNFLLTLLVYFVFMMFTGVSFGPHLFLMVYPILCMIIFNLGISYILSALFVFFRDIQYLYSIATTLLMYMSAIFYYADSLPDNIQIVFALNPVYRYISYMRQLVIDSSIPSLSSHLICLAFAVIALIIGYLFHKKTEKNFVYYY